MSRWTPATADSMQIFPPGLFSDFSILALKCQEVAALPMGHIFNFRYHAPTPFTTKYRL